MFAFLSGPTTLNIVNIPPSCTVHMSSSETKATTISKFFGLDPQMHGKVLDFLLERMVTRNFPARELITEAGRQERYFYVVEEGVQGLYLISPSGDKVVLAFSFHGSPSGIYDSFVQGTPSSLFLEALRPSTMYGINRQDYQYLLDHYPAILHWKAQFFESVLLGRLSREVELLTMTARERYDAFVARCPPPLLTIPQKYLASYLNMTPETFSRLRGKRD